MNFHRHPSSKWLYLKGNNYWRYTHFQTMMMERVTYPPTQKKKVPQKNATISLADVFSSYPTFKKICTNFSQVLGSQKSNNQILVKNQDSKISPTGPPGRWAPGRLTNSLSRNFFLCWGFGEVWGIFFQGMWAKSLKDATKFRKTHQDDT